jgi:hypothetical protein
MKANLSSTLLALMTACGWLGDSRQAEVVIHAIDRGQPVIDR